MAQIPIHSRNIARLRGKEARRQNLNFATIAASKIASTLGPAGAYKMILYNRGPERVVKVTKNAVEILSELEVQYPAVKTVAEAARIHREQVGEGVSTFVILLANLLKEAERLTERRIHTNVVLRGYRAAALKALALVEENALLIDANQATDRILDNLDCGRGLLVGGLRTSVLEAIARAESNGGVDLSRVAIVRRSGGSTSDSQLIKGIVIRKGKAHPSMADTLQENVKVAVLTKKLDLRPLDLKMKGEGPFKLTLSVTDSIQIAEFRSAESMMRSEMVKKILAVGTGVLVCRSKIEARIADALARSGVLALELVDQKEIDAVARATGATIVSDADDLRAGDLGRASKVEALKIEGVDCTSVEAVGGSTLLLRGSSTEALEELKDTVDRALLLVKNSRRSPKLVFGGGAVYMHAAKELREFSLEFQGREQIAIQSFAEAMEDVAACLARNHGLDWPTTLTELRSHHSNDQHSFGVSRYGCADMQADQVYELASVSKAVIRRAYEVAALLLRVDEYFFVKNLPMVHKR